MKKGCFITVIVVLTVVLFAVFYLVKHNGDELIEFGTDQLVEFAQSNIISDIDELEQNKYVDSLKIVVVEYFRNIDTLDVKEELERIDVFSDDIEVILMDSKIDSVEFDFITNILINYEQRKEN